MDINGNDKESTSHQASSQPTTCKSSTCTFFGGSSTEGYCSVCYKDLLKKRNAPPAAATATTTTTNNNNNNKTTKASSSEMEENTVALENQSSSKIEETTTNNNNTSKDSPQTERPQTPKITNEKLAELWDVPKPISTPEIISKPSSSSTSNSTEQKIISDIASPSNSAKSTPNKPKKRKCQMCKKKIGLTGFECRCGKLFCSLHRYADAHNCTFDYKEDGREKIRKANPTCTDDKITRF